MSKNYILDLPDNEKLQITIFGENNFENSPCLIHVHGFKGFKDWGFNPYLAEYFGNNGYFVITFNFSHNGIGENPLEFTELDKFANNTYSREIRELNSVILAYREGFFGAERKNNIGLIGHSRGGGVSLLTAAENNEVKAIALWASISKLDRYSERQKDKWEKLGYLEMINARTKQVMHLNYSMLEDIVKNNLDIKKAVQNLNKPLFVAHGEQDLAVPIAEGQEIYEWSNNSNSEFSPIKSTGHTFDCKHPFEGSNEKFNFLLEKTKDFFDRQLK